MASCWIIVVSSIKKQRAILRGQVISLFIAGTGVFATLLSKQSPSANFPTLMSLCNYVILSTFLFRNKCFAITSFQWRSIDIYKTSEWLSLPYIWYLLSAVLDLEANFLVISAYNYTTVTSIMILDCFTIPCVMIISYYYLHYKYTYKHILGALLCTSGVGIIVLCDSTLSSDTNVTTTITTTTNLFLGDVLCLCGSMLYACSNVLQETLVKTNNREEFLGFLGMLLSLMYTFYLIFRLIWPYFRLILLLF